MATRNLMVGLAVLGVILLVVPFGIWGGIVVGL